jgi:hypothetical protein
MCKGTAEVERKGSCFLISRFLYQYYQLYRITQWCAISTPAGRKLPA